jgi:hypothetical protein
VDRLVVRGEQDAWQLLAHSLERGRSSWGEAGIAFQDWPRLDIYVAPGDGYGTREILYGLSKLQSAVDRGFALLKHGVPDARRLTTDERDTLRLKWRIETGSTELRVGLYDATNEFARVAAGKMNGSQALCLGLGWGLMMCATAGFVGYLWFKAEIRKEEIRLQEQHELTHLVEMLSGHHEKQMQLLKQAYERDQTAVVRLAASDYIPWRPALLDIAPLSGSITINGVVVDGPLAKKIARNSKAARRERVAHPLAFEAQWLTTIHPSRP